MNLVDLKRIIKSVIDPLDHRHLDLDIPYFRDKSRYLVTAFDTTDMHISKLNEKSTTENLVVYIWKELTRLWALESWTLDPMPQLYRIKIWETENNMVEYYGD